MHHLPSGILSEDGAIEEFWEAGPETQSNIPHFLQYLGVTVEKNAHIIDPTIHPLTRF